MLPADKPEVVIYVAVDNPKGTVQFGGVVAAPIVGKIMEDSLHVMGVKPRKNQIEKEKKWNDPIMIEVPDLIGMTKKDLQTQLIDLKIGYCWTR